MSDGTDQGSATQRLLQGSGTRPQGCVPASCFQEARQCPGSSVPPKWCPFNTGGKGCVDERTPPWEEEVT